MTLSRYRMTVGRVMTPVYRGSWLHLAQTPTRGTAGQASTSLAQAHVYALTLIPLVCSLIPTKSPPDLTLLHVQYWVFCRFVGSG